MRPLTRARAERITCERRRRTRVTNQLLGLFSQQFNEIMPAIYARFMEKEAKQWREIYKVLPSFRPLSSCACRGQTLTIRMANLGTAAARISDQKRLGARRR
jgi:hypothetical protein